MQQYTAEQLAERKLAFQEYSLLLASIDCQVINGDQREAAYYGMYQSALQAHFSNLRFATDQKEGFLCMTAPQLPIVKDYDVEQDEDVEQDSALPPSPESPDPIDLFRLPESPTPQRTRVPTIDLTAIPVRNAVHRRKVELKITKLTIEPKKAERAEPEPQRAESERAGPKTPIRPVRRSTPAEIRYGRSYCIPDFTVKVSRLMSAKQNPTGPDIILLCCEIKRPLETQSGNGLQEEPSTHLLESLLKVASQQLKEQIWHVFHNKTQKPQVFGMIYGAGLLWRYLEVAAEEVVHLIRYPKKYHDQAEYVPDEEKMATKNLIDYTPKELLGFFGNSGLLSWKSPKSDECMTLIAQRLIEKNPNIAAWD